MKKASGKKPLTPASVAAKTLKQNQADTKPGKAAAARKATMVATTHYVDDEPVPVDEHDEAAKAGLSRQRARRRAVRRKDEARPGP